MIEQDEYRGGLFRWVGGLAQALMREPAIILLERDGDGPRVPHDQDDQIGSCPAASCP